MTTKGFNNDLPPRDVRIPDHRLVSCIGRGSYGEVWLAQNMLGTYRAVKIVRQDSFENERPFARELAGLERFEPISRSHEGFVDILQIGQSEQERYFYYIMELGDGDVPIEQLDPKTYAPKTLTTELARCERFTVERCVDIGIGLCDALAYLHNQGLVHRDLKPSNIIFVQGKPKLADIGLVAAFSEAQSYVGTEGYIPPEGPGQPTADIYSLGKLLYEMATGQDRHAFPALPPDADTFPDKHLLMEMNEVFLKASHHDVKHRYQTAGQLLSDLVVIKNGQSVKRLRYLESRLAQLKKIGIAAAVAAAVFGGIYLQYSYNRDQRIRNLQQVGGGLVFLATSTMNDGDYLGAMPSFDAAQGLWKSYNPNAHDDNLRLRLLLDQIPKIEHAWFFEDRIEDVSFSPSGDRILMSIYRDQSVIYDTDTGKITTPPFGELTKLMRSDFSHDGKWVLQAGFNEEVRIHESATGRLAQVVKLPQPGYATAFHPSTNQFATGTYYGTLDFWTYETGDNGEMEIRRISDIEAHDEQDHTPQGYYQGIYPNLITSVTYSHDGTRVITTSQNHTAKIWDIKTGQQIGPPLRASHWIYDAAWSPDDRLIATASFDRWVTVWNAATGEKQFYRKHGDGVRKVSFSADGTLLMCAALEGTVHLYQVYEDGAPAVSFPVLRHNNRVIGAAFHPDGHRLATVCVDGTVRLWNLAGAQVTPKPLAGRFSEDGTCYSLATADGIELFKTAVPQTESAPIGSFPGAKALILSPNNRWALTSEHNLPTAGRTNAVWTLQRVSRNPTEPPEAVFQGSLPGDRLLVGNSGHFLASADASTLHLFMRRKDDWAQTNWSHPGLKAMTASNHGDRLAVLNGNILTVYNTLTGQKLFIADDHDAPLVHAAFSPDDKFIVACPLDSTFESRSLYIRNVATGELLHDPIPHGDGIMYAVFSDDGHRLVSTTENFLVLVWNPSTGERMIKPMEHRHRVHFAAFDNGNRKLVTVSKDDTARIFNVDTRPPLPPDIGMPFSPPIHHSSSTNLARAAFLPDEKGILTMNEEGQAWAWLFPYENLTQEDIAFIAQLYLGYRVDEQGGKVPIELDRLQIIYHTLKERLPEVFTVSPQRLEAWHTHMMEYCQSHEYPFGVAFHQQALRALHETPPDP